MFETYGMIQACIGKNGIRCPKILLFLLSRERDTRHDTRPDNKKKCILYFFKLLIVFFINYSFMK